MLFAPTCRQPSRSPALRPFRKAILQPESPRRAGAGELFGACAMIGFFLVMALFG